MKTPDVDKLVEQTAKALLSDQHVWISGGVGAGKHTTAAFLRERVPDVRVVEFVDLTHGDGVAGSLLQLAASLPERSDREEIVDVLSDADEAGSSVARAFGRRTASLVALLPSSWTASASTNSGEAYIQQRARTLMRSLAEVPRVVWIVDAQMSPEELGFRVDIRLPLPRHRVAFPSDFERWREYARAAEQVARLARDVEASPLVWRLAVGVSALGAEPARVSAAIHAPAVTALSRLCRLLNDKLKANPTLCLAVSRALLPRVPVPREALLALTQVPNEHAPLITECIGYGDPVRVSETLRERLLDSGVGEQPSLAETHLGLAEHFEKQDGVSDPRGVSSVEGMSAWVEKAHHLGRTGNAGLERWLQLDMPSPDFYWDRGRFLSMEMRDFSGAAEVYRRCVEKFPADDYAHHYLAWNLERGQREWSEVRTHYAEAVQHNPTNPWWNSRLVCALIRQRRYPEAEASWREALDRVDPDGTATVRSPWLACHFYWWVAEAWADAGAWRQGMLVAQAVPQRVRERAKEERSFDDLEQRLRHMARKERAAFEAWLANKHGGAWGQARSFWNELLSTAPGIPAPAASDTDEGSAQLVWSHSDILLEVELDGSGMIEWYARDRQTGEDAGSDEPVGSDDPALMLWLHELENV